LTNFPYMFSFLEGILTFISPCILPMLPIYFFYLAGVSGEEEIRRGKLLLNSTGFVFGFTTIFVILGATATTLGNFINGNISIFRHISGLIMIVFGLNFMGIFNLNFLNVDKRLNYSIKDLNLIKSIVFGMVFAFGWTPCVGVFLGSALLIASNSNSIWQGIILLLLYSAGLGLPFILSAILFDSINTTFRQIQRFHRIIGIVSGLVLVLAGVLVFTNKLNYLSFW
jgi:cytochrome c-type biogenesis protein